MRPSAKGLVMNTTEFAAPADERRGSALTASTSIFLSPTRAFAEIARGATWLWPFVICIVVGLLRLLIIGPAADIVWEEQRAQMMAGNPSLTPEAVERFRTIGNVMQYVMIPVTTLLAFVLAAVVFHLALLAFGAGIGFKKVLRAMAYAALVSFAAYTLLTSIVVALQYRAGQVETAADVALPRVGLDLLAPGAEGHVRGILHAVNVFSIWWLVVLVYGFAVLTGKPRGRVAVPVLVAGVAWILFSGWLAGFAARSPAG
jgi:hypothetical protein